VNEERKGAQEAEDLIEDLGFDALPIVPEEFASAISGDHYKLDFQYQHFNETELLGSAVGDSEAAVVRVNSNISGPGRKNFTAAHELGHVCMHIMPGTNLEFSCGPSEFYDPYNDPVEKEANGFAAGLLMPSKLIKQVCDGDVNWANIKRVTDESGASLEAAARRLITLSRDSVTMVIHKDGKFVRWLPCDRFDAYFIRSPLSEDQLDLCMNGRSNEFYDDFEEVDAEDWVRSKVGTEFLETIHSSSIALERGFVYTLLRYDEE
jgi:Zn-dependent peptidase ImmA (M78 family)